MSRRKIEWLPFKNMSPNSGVGLALVIIKGAIPTLTVIENNEISSYECFIFSYDTISPIIENNIIIDASFITANIAGNVKDNYFLQKSSLDIGIQNWEAGNYNHIMGRISANYFYPNSVLSCFGSSKNGVSFENNVIFISSMSKILTDYSINNCKIEGSFKSTAVLDSEVEFMYLLGNDSDVIRKVAIYDIGN